MTKTFPLANTPMEKFTYHGILQLKRLLMQLLGVTAIIVFNITALLLLYGVNVYISVEPSANFFDDPRVPYFGLASGFILISWTVGGAFLNFLPTIWVSEAGIEISAFLLLRIKLPWNAVTEVIPVKVAMGTVPTKYTLVIARKITLFHRVFGWLYLTTLRPGFLIHEDIENYHHLIQIIRNRKAVTS